MDIPDQFKEVRFLVTDNGFIAVLKKMAVPAVTFIVTDRITSRHTTHISGNADVAAAQKKVCVIGEQRPGVYDGVGIGCDFAQPLDKIIPIFIVIHDPTPLNTSHDDMMQTTRNI